MMQIFPVSITCGPCELEIRIKSILMSANILCCVARAVTFGGVVVDSTNRADDNGGSGSRSDATNQHGEPVSQVKTQATLKHVKALTKRTEDHCTQLVGQTSARTFTLASEKLGLGLGGQPFRGSSGRAVTAK